jgi:hypothetical protein
MQSVLYAGCQVLQRRLRDLQAENERLRRQLDAATRAGKRQAAPFAKGQPAAQPKNADNRGRLTCLFHTQFSAQSSRFFSVFWAVEVPELSAI